VSRNCEYRGGARRPILSDLRESGSFEQNADKILFLYRPEYYGFEIDENGDSTKNLMEIIVAKNRNGYIGRATVKHNLPYGGIVPFTPQDSRIEFSVNRLSELDESDPPF
jgi:replicative DNA helicase